MPDGGICFSWSRYGGVNKQEEQIKEEKIKEEQIKDEMSMHLCNFGLAIANRCAFQTK